MTDPDQPSKIPSLIPFVVMALLLVVIYAGVMLFPTIKAMVGRQDCIGSGREDCTNS